MADIEFENKIRSALRNLGDSDKLIAIKANPYTIYMIDEPTEEMQFTAVKLNQDAIKWIKNPTEEVKKLSNELWVKN
jgi:hypothetical protein